MPELILHHYPNSPFSEKVRLVLGFKRLAWRSVIVPSLMPKPDVLALTGGYRRTPFLQIGADIYCDSALMCRVIDALQPEPALLPADCAGLAEIVAQWADTALFWTAVPYTLQPAGAVHVMAGATPDTMKAFGADRAAMNPNFRRPTPADAGAALHTYLDRLDRMLHDGREFLLGAQASIADFSTVQSIWFMHLAPPIAALLEGRPLIATWYRRVQAFGHGTATLLASGEAIAIAAAAVADPQPTPASFAAEPGLEQGAAVTVTPTDYAHDPVAGRLVGLAFDEVVVERDDPRAGCVRVHFPRIGFQIKPQPPA